MLEMERFLVRHSIVDFRMNPYFPINTLNLMRGAIAADKLGLAPAYIDCIYDGMWVRGLDLGQPAVVADVLSSAGLPAERLFELAQSPAIKQRLLDNIQVAFEMGAFGSPSLVVNGALFFGKDRLREVEEEVERSRSV
jgi:2-hydroxychromene-2-carboxylate isomerase